MAHKAVEAVARTLRGRRRSVDVIFRAQQFRHQHGSAGGAALYYLSGNTEFAWQTYQSLPDTGFNGIPVALLAACNPIGVIFTGIFMSMLDVAGTQLTALTPFNEYITDVVIATIVYLSAFSLVIKMLISGGKKHKKAKAAPAAEVKAEAPPEDAKAEKGGEAK